jgi:hypothetical protein
LTGAIPDQEEYQKDLEMGLETLNKQLEPLIQHKPTASSGNEYVIYLIVNLTESTLSNMDKGIMLTFSWRSTGSICLRSRH